MFPVYTFLLLEEFVKRIIASPRNGYKGKEIRIQEKT